MSPGGSSPLSRGIRVMPPLRGEPGRIIPALAGNTQDLPSPRADRADHPRSRGEYAASSTAAARSSGSSPLSRGILCCGICGSSHSEDHPRSRGEYLGLLGGGEKAKGSSPLSRGILASKHTRPTFLRIIPALAGNTASSVYWGTRKTDHPRSRGEYMWPLQRRLRLSGSSPLSRGIQWSHQ